MKLFNDLMSTDYEGRCGNCHKFLEPNDKFCRYCGTRVGEGKFAPYDNRPYCIYGPPPVERKHKCPGCGFSWTTDLMIDNEKFCPKCGNSAPAIHL